MEIYNNIHWYGPSKTCKYLRNEELGMLHVYKYKTETGIDVPNTDIHHIDLDPLKDKVSIKFQEYNIPVYGNACSFQKIDNFKKYRYNNGQIAGFEYVNRAKTIIRMGYNLFEEVNHILTNGQPRENAAIPSIDLHIDLIRNWIIKNRFWSSY